MGRVFWAVEWDFLFLFPLPDFSVCSDAPGGIGYDAFMDDDWLNGPWSPHQIPLSIACKKLFPVVLAAHIWGLFGLVGVSCFMSITIAVVHILNSQTSPDPNIMHLLRSMSK